MDVRSRAVSGVAWFMATLVGWEIVWSLVGVPRVLGPVLALTLTAVVVFDPAGLFWRAGTDRAEPSDRLTNPLAPERAGHST